MKLVCMAAVAAATLSSAGARGADLKLVVYPVDAAELSDRQFFMVESHLVAELNKRAGVVAQSWEAAADQSVDRTACREDRGCLSRIANALGADLVVTARVNRVHDSDVLTLKALDLRAADVRSVVTKTAPAKDGVLTVLGAAVGELFVSHGLRPGRHDGVPAAYASRWDPKPLHPALFWTGVALTAGFSVAVGTFGMLAGEAQRDYHELAAASVSSSVSGALLNEKGDRLLRYANLTNGFIVGAAVVFTGTFIAAFFTDWDYGDPDFAVTAGAGEAAALIRF